MPMVDVYAAERTFTDKYRFAQNLAQAVMRCRVGGDLHVSGCTSHALRRETW